MMAAGTISASQAIATWKGPFLRGINWSGPMDFDLLRVPSGAMPIFILSVLHFAAVLLRVVMAEPRFSRSMGMMFPILRSVPKIGILNSDFFATKLM
jgi:hypothetical protein